MSFVGLKSKLHRQQQQQEEDKSATVEVVLVNHTVGLAQGLDHVVAPDHEHAAHQAALASTSPRDTTTTATSSSSSSSSSSGSKSSSSSFFRSISRSANRRSMSPALRKSRTWGPDEPSVSASSTDGTAATPVRRGTRIFRKGAGRLPLSSVSGPVKTTQSVRGSGQQQEDRTPPLWLPLVSFLCRVVEQHGMHKMGIFRLSANARLVKELMTACATLYDQRAGEEAMERLFAPYDEEVDVAASVLKAYLREQIEPLIPTSYHDRFVSVPPTDQLDARLAALKEIVAELPEERRQILDRLMQSLHLIQACQEQNRMDASNLAIVFAPSVLRADTEGLDILKIRSQCVVIETFILYHGLVFTPQSAESQSTPEEIDQSDDMSKEDVAAQEKSKEKEPEPESHLPAVEEQDESAQFNATVDMLTKEASEEAPRVHQWVKEKLHLFSSVSCKHCHKGIHGFRQKAYTCKGCRIVAHKKCRKELVHHSCVETQADEDGSNKQFPLIQVSAPVLLRH